MAGINHTALETAMSKVPNARFEDATDVIGLVRFVKSAEEIQFVRRSAEVAAAGLDELIRLARPGIDAGVYYSDVLAKILALCSEYFPITLTIDAIDTAKPHRYTNPPIGRRLEAGAFITNEINAIMGAQLTQVCQPVLLGEIPDAWKPMVALQREVYEAGLHFIKPGVSFGALEDFVSGFGSKRGMRAILQMHGCGYGDDGPRFTLRTKNDGARELAIEKNNTFVWKPTVLSADGQIQFTFGGPVVVTETGCEALFKRDPELVSLA
jgi:Xaa-Pro aminopeptidase